MSNKIQFQESNRVNDDVLVNILITIEVLGKKNQIKNQTKWKKIQNRYNIQAICNDRLLLVLLLFEYTENKIF